MLSQLNKSRSCFQLKYFLLEVTGKIIVVEHPFEDPAVTAIHQGSIGLFRKANHLARGALIAAADQKETIVTAEPVRLAATEVF